MAWNRPSSHSLAKGNQFGRLILIARVRSRQREGRIRGHRGVILNALVLSSGVIPPCTAQATRLILQVRGGGRGDARRLNPEGGPLFASAEGWPPFVGSSLPFWVACFCLVAAMIMLSRSRRGDDPHPLDVPLVAYAGFLGGVWGIIFALPFRDLDTWPRDSAIAGVIQIICAIRVVVEVSRGRRRRNQSRARDQATFAESTDGQHWHRVRPAGAGLPSGDE